MCPTGNQETQNKGSKRRCWLMKKVDKWAEDKKEKLHLEITHFEIHGYTRSQGLIIRLKVEFSYPLCCDITKCWKSATYSLKIDKKELFSGEVKPSKTPRKKVFSGEVKPSKTPRKKGEGKEVKSPVEEKKTVEVEINISPDHLKDKFEEIKQSIALNRLNCEVELKMSVIGIRDSLPATFAVKPETVSGALREYGMPKLKNNMTEYNIAGIALDIYEGKDFIGNVDELLRVLFQKSHQTLYGFVHRGLATAKELQEAMNFIVGEKKD